jgi:hypothetical protein
MHHRQTDDADVRASPSSNHPAFTLKNWLGRQQFLENNLVGARAIRNPALTVYSQFSITLLPDRGSEILSVTVIAYCPASERC